MGTDLTIGLVGATGALGQEILEVLDKTRWRPSAVVPFASLASKTPFVEYGGENVAVEDVSYLDIEALDALILAVPEDRALELGEASVRAGLPVIDASGAWHRDDASIPLVVPWVNPDVLVALARPVVSLPGSASLLLASVLAPLVRAGVRAHVDATVLLPASDLGRKGIDELSQQVIALFNQSVPPRRVFEEGLAFDLLPELGDRTPDGWTELEARVAHEVTSLLGGACTVSATLVRAPLFTGISATLVIRADRRSPLDLVAQVLSDGGVVVPEARTARDVPRPRRVQGKPFAHVGRIREDPTGGVHLWATSDNVRAAASVAVAAAGALLRDRIV